MYQVYYFVYGLSRKTKKFPVQLKNNKFQIMKIVKNCYKLFFFFFVNVCVFLFYVFCLVPILWYNTQFRTQKLV